MYSILKRGHSIFVETDPETAKQYNKGQNNNQDEPLSLIKPDKLPHQVETDCGKDVWASERAVPHGDSEVKSDCSETNVGRPTLLSVMIGVHWKHTAKNGQNLHVYIHYDG